MKYTIILSGESKLARDALRLLLLDLEKVSLGHGTLDECKLILPGNGFNPDTSTPTTIRTEQDREARRRSPQLVPIFAPAENPFKELRAALNEETPLVAVAEKLEQAEIVVPRKRGGKKAK